VLPQQRRSVGAGPDQADRLLPFQRAAEVFRAEYDPCTNPDSRGLRALHATDAGGQLRREQAVVDGLGGEVSDCRNPNNDRRGPEAANFLGIPAKR